MSEVTLTATAGRPTGTGNARRIRAEGRVPAVVYGAGKPATTVTIDRRELRQALNTDAGQNALITLDVDGDELVTVVRELQRHPVRRDVTHVDFMTVDPTKPIEVEVPIHLEGEARGVARAGGITEQRISVLRMRVRPDSIPDAITVDITDMSLDRSILVKDLELPDGCVSVTNPQQAVVTAELTRAAVNVRQQEGEEAEDEESEES